MTARGERSALRLMKWFGIDCLPNSGASLSSFLSHYISLCRTLELHNNRDNENVDIDHKKKWKEEGVHHSV